MSDQHQHLEALAHATVVDENGTRVGPVSQLFLDDQTHRPSWVTVRTGTLGGGETYVPLEGHELTGDEIRVPYAADFIKRAPSAGEGHLDRGEEDRLYAYYRIDALGAEARDQTDPAHGHIPPSQRDTDGAAFNNTAGLHEPRPGVSAERASDADGGMDKPVVPAAQAIPPEVGAEGPSAPRQGEGTTGFPPAHGASGQGASGRDNQRLRRYERS